MTITLYDLASIYGAGTWSPNVWKIRYALNYKNIPYKTEWVEYPDIAPLSKKLGIRPTVDTPEFTLYTVPAIHDPATGIYMADSVAIVEYLEKQYPDAPTVFPNDSWGLQLFFEDALSKHVSPIWPWISPAIIRILNSPSQEYYRRACEKEFGKALEEVVPRGDDAVSGWAKTKVGFSKVAEWYTKRKDQGPFLMGDTVSWADFVMSAELRWYCCGLGEDSEKWQEIRTWDGGFWGRLVGAMRQYEQIK